MAAVVAQQRITKSIEAIEWENVNEVIVPQMSPQYCCSFVSCVSLSMSFLEVSFCVPLSQQLVNIWIPVVHVHMPTNLLQSDEAASTVA
jgi:hypothetical protein